VRGGAVLRGEVLARWQEFVGTGELMRSLETRIGQLRDRVVSFFTGRPAAGSGVREAVESSLESLVRAAADRAAERTVEAWSAEPAGAALVRAAGRPLGEASPEFQAAVRDEVRDWQGYVLSLVSSQGAQRRTAARLASFGVNGAGLVLMLAVFAQTGGLTGAEVAVAGGTSVVSQKVLEAVFGDTAVRLLAAQARDDLMERVDRLLTAERGRFDALLAEAAPAPDTGSALRASLDGFERARRAYRSGAA